MTRYKQYLLGGYLHGFSLPRLCTVFSLGAQSGRQTKDSEGTRAVFLRIIYLLAKAPDAPLPVQPKQA